MGEMMSTQSAAGVRMNLRSFLEEPLRGKTSLSKVFWLYGVLGSVLVSAVGLAFDPGNRFVMRVYILFGLLYSVYVTVATYQCAGNCGSKVLARFVRFSAVISLVLLPVFAYLEFTGALDFALSSLSGEQ
jgi:hypothetical protein